MGNKPPHGKDGEKAYIQAIRKEQKFRRAIAAGTSASIAAGLAFFVGRPDVAVALFVGHLPLLLVIYLALARWGYPTSPRLPE